MSNLYNELLELVIDDESKIKICEIDFDSTLNEDNVTDVDLKKIGKCYIYVFTNEGESIPHFHVRSKDKKLNGDYKLDAAICINYNKYFSHGNHKDTLTNAQQKQLNKKLDEVIDKDSDDKTTYWKKIQDIYYKAKPNSKEKRADTQPNYDNIDPYK